MTLRQTRWKSKVLDKEVWTNVIVPGEGTGPFAAYYLLHGLGDDHTTWTANTRIEAYAAEYPLVVVMPEGFRGFYTDNEDGPAYGKYIGEELVEMIEREFPVKKETSARCIGGQSMGGYGALNIGLTFAGKFKSVNSHSGGLMSGSRGTPPDRFAEAERIFGKHPAGGEHDLVRLAREAKAAGKLPKIRIDCGREDFLLRDNREYHQALVGMNIEHEYEEFGGNHDWAYWDLHVREALAFHAGNLGLRKKALENT